MITTEELEAEGFEFYEHTKIWCRDRIGLFMDDGIVTFIREHENYHGLSVKITSIEILRTFLSVVE